MIAGFLTCMFLAAGIGVALVLSWLVCVACTEAEPRRRSLPGALGSSPWRELDEAEES